MIEYDPHRWWSHFLDVRGSMVRQIAARVAVCVLWSVVVAVLHKRGWIPTFPPTAHGLIGVALGLLLVFRTNSSYDRFWEGRKQWGNVVNETRNLGRAAVTFLSAEPALATVLVRWTVAYPWALMHRLRGERSLGPAAPALDADEAQLALEAPHVPTAIAVRMGAALREAHARGAINHVLHAALDGHVARLLDCSGACERIQSTPMPFAYAVHLRRAVIIYTVTLPPALVTDFGWGAIVATFLLSYTMFGIEEIGVEIENPFGLDDNDLPLEDICRRIQAQLEGLLAGPG